MLRYLSLFFFLKFILILQNSLGNTIIQNRNGEIEVVYKEYQSLYPNITFQKMTKMNGAKQQIVYEFGKRITGDKLLSEKRDQQNFPSLKDVQAVIRYPDEGEAETISYVFVLVDQSSNIGEGYLIDGGIEKKFIKVLIEANNTLQFCYVASFYGY